MSAITLPDARAILAKLIEVQKNDPVGALTSVTVAGQTFSFKSARDLTEMVDYWSAIVSRLEREASGRQIHGRSRAVFT